MVHQFKKLKRVSIEDEDGTYQPRETCYSGSERAMLISMYWFHNHFDLSLRWIFVSSMQLFLVPLWPLKGSTLTPPFSFWKSVNLHSGPFGGKVAIVELIFPFCHQCVSWGKHNWQTFFWINNWVKKQWAVKRPSFPWHFSMVDNLWKTYQDLSCICIWILLSIFNHEKFMQNRIIHCIRIETCLYVCPWY